MREEVEKKEEGRRQERKGDKERPPCSSSTSPRGRCWVSFHTNMDQCVSQTTNKFHFYPPEEKKKKTEGGRSNLPSEEVRMEERKEVNEEVK